MYPPSPSDAPPPTYGGGAPSVGAPSAGGATGKAIVILVLGIFGVVCCPVTAPVAWVLGQSELAAVRRGAAPAANEALAQIGMVLGILGTILFVFFLLWFFVFGGLAMLSVLLHS